MSMPPPEDVIMIDQQEEEPEHKPTTDELSQPRRTDHDWQLYYIPTQPLPQSRPHPSQNLISLFKLDDIAASVRRTDPTTGEKINKIRKSYEGKVKQLQISGVNKAVSTPREFINGGILDMPEAEWHAQMVSGRPLQKSITPDFLAKLERAVQMAPGSLPPREADKWKKFIGNEEAAPKGKVPVDVAKKNGIISPVQSARQSAATPLAQSATSRPVRSTKRAYTDDTFEGYGDTMDFAELSEDELRERGTQKKRQRTSTGRKVSGARFY